MFEKDTMETSIVETIPIIGFLAAKVHKAKGNDEHSSRAVAKCTNSSVTMIGTISGFMLAGPLGGFAAGFLSSLMGNAAEATIADNCINDMVIRKDCSDHSLMNYVSAGALGAVSSGMSGTGNQAAKGILREMGVRGIRKGIAGAFGGKLLSFLFSDVPKLILHKETRCERVRIAAFDGSVWTCLLLGDIVNQSQFKEPSEIFEIIYLEDDVVVFMYRDSNHGDFYIQVDDECALSAHSKVATERSLFQITKHGDKVSFRHLSSDKYVSCYPLMKMLYKMLNLCALPSPGKLELFHLVDAV